MKKYWSILLAIAVQVHAWAGTTIDAVNHLAYGANVGWLDWRGDTANGAVIGENVCSGNLYAANVGWISLGNGSPTNGIQYQNYSAADFGVNHDGVGNLRGFAWGANIGWISFENSGAPRVDLFAGKLSGAAWSANCGWISLSNAVAVVQTDHINSGSLAPNGLPVAWLLANFGTTNVDAAADPDHDGLSNAQEYLAGTNPNDAASALRITGFSTGVPLANSVSVNWNSVPGRFYVLQKTTSLSSGAWTDWVNNPVAGLNNVLFTDASTTNGFFRIRAYRPLMP